MVKKRPRSKNTDSSTVNISHNSASSDEKEKIMQNGLSETNALKKANEHRHEEHHYSKMNWWYEDRSSVLLLFFLYVLQGIPLGLAGSIPMLLASRSVDYKQQALFSFVFWPFSIKLLWAPIVDGAYFSRFGRRKSWLVPTQYFIAIVMYILSQRLHDMLEVPSPDIWHLTVCFFFLNFCAATQDIAVDGWALTMLSEKNVGLASTCNSVGQVIAITTLFTGTGTKLIWPRDSKEILSPAVVCLLVFKKFTAGKGFELFFLLLNIMQTAGYFLGYTVFLALESADFCNKYLRTEPQSYGAVTLSDFMYFWSIVFFITTTLVMLLKKEDTSHNVSPEESKGVLSTYKLLWRIIRLPSVLQYVIILLTCKMAFATESMVGLKLIECGIHKESLALLAIPLTPLQILLPLIIAKYTSGPRPLDILLKALTFRLLFTPIFALVVHWTPLFKQEDGTYPYYYFAIIVLIYCLHQVSLYSMFVSLMAFNAKVSDPRIGGTYMTLLNTVANLGGNWPQTLALWYVDSLTVNNCVNGDVEFCTKDTKEACVASGGHCNMSVDGYYVESVVCFIIGIIWFLWKSKATRKLQEVKPREWKCPI